MCNHRLSPRVGDEDSRVGTCTEEATLATLGQIGVVTSCLGHLQAERPWATFIVLGLHCPVCIIGVTRCSSEADMEGPGDKGEPGYHKPESRASCGDMAGHIHTYTHGYTYTKKDGMMGCPGHMTSVHKEP